jgi:hypothetical protein
MQSMHKKDIHERASPQFMQKYFDENSSLPATRFMQTTDRIKTEMTMDGTFRRRIL